MFDLIFLIESIGYLGLFTVIFFESGILLGFFLPGDSLLFTSGLLASTEFFNILILIPLFFVAAITGDSVGYFLGKKFGPKIFNKKESIFFNPDHVKRVSAFYEKYGGKTIFLARFIPIIRTFAPVAAGVGKMEYKKFLFYNIFGGAVWSVTLPLMGYFFGKSIPQIDNYILLIIVVIIIVSFLPIAKEILKKPQKKD